MPRGMDERFDDPSGDTDGTEPGDDGATSDADPRRRATADGQSARDRAEPSAEGTTPSEASDADDDPLNIREDWDSATIYVEPDQSEEIEVTFARLKKRLKREDVVLEKNKHFYRGVFEVAFGEHREETKERIRELAEREDE